MSVEIATVIAVIAKAQMGALKWGLSLLGPLSATRAQSSAIVHVYSLLGPFAKEF